MYASFQYIVFPIYSVFHFLLRDTLPSMDVLLIRSHPPVTLQFARLALNLLASWHLSSMWPIILFYTRVLAKDPLTSHWMFWNKTFHSYVKAMVVAAWTLVCLTPKIVELLLQGITCFVLLVILGAGWQLIAFLALVGDLLDEICCSK